MPPQITIVGLGSGEISQMNLGVWEKLKKAKVVYLRTADHPSVDVFKEHSISYKTFDEVYMKFQQFDEVYQMIVTTLFDIACSTQEEIIYAVPGHPMVAETTVQLLLKKCKTEGMPVSLFGGESFLDRAFLCFGFDPMDGFQLLDATRMSRYMLQPLLHTIVGQVYDQSIASEVKLTLMEVYPHDYKIYIGHSLGVDNKERIDEVFLYELDRVKEFGNLSLVWVPKCEEIQLQQRDFGRLHEIIQILRSPEGCPWDRMQTHSSLRKHLIEETYEVLEAMDGNDSEHFCEELGDVLLQVMLHAQIEEESGVFDVFDVIAKLNQKLIRRHPHVFQDVIMESADEVMINWNKIKAEEKQNKGQIQKSSILAGIPKELPTLIKALHLQERASRVGFDWNKADEVIEKVREELMEVECEMLKAPSLPTQEQKAEVGDLLFAVINLARFLQIDPDEALSLTNTKFIHRFSMIEKQLLEDGKTFDEVNIQYMEYIWKQTKK